jgi:hypothetical protein
MKRLCVLVGAWMIGTTLLSGVDYNHLKSTLHKGMQPKAIAYPLKIRVLPGREADEPVMICFHGSGSNNKIADIIHSYDVVDHHLVSFNFPDHDIRDDRDPQHTTCGSIAELLPAFYVLKKTVVDGRMDQVYLYGFSAGGGAIVNVIALLNSNRYEEELKGIGIGLAEKQQIKQAIKNGLVILDCPLKSMDEILVANGYDPDMSVLARRYRDNQLKPIDTVQKWAGMPVNVIVHFQVPDEALTNRDDQLFISRLQEANKKGNTWVVIGKDGGHNAYHESLWSAFSTIYHSH